MEECRRLAFQLADLNGIDHPFNKTLQIAGKGWMQGFLCRHPELSIRKPEATSGMRARGFNKVCVSQFFTLPLKLVEKYKFTADKIYNVDETGVTVNPKGASKILAVKGKRQVGALTSALTPINPQPGTSKTNGSAFPLSSPIDVIPIPQCNETAKRNSRKKGKTAVLTSTPYKIDLEQSLEKSVKNKTAKERAVKRKIGNGGNTEKAVKKGIKKAKSLKKSQHESDSDDSHESDARCLYCGEFYSTSCEGWIACTVCLRWAHNSCVGIGDEDDETILVCELCK